MQILNLEGFTLIWCPTASPLATAQILVNAGSLNEKVWGTAHFLEHVFFKGTKRRSYEEMHRLVASLGDTNAFTGEAITGYHIDTTGRNLKRAFALLCEQFFEATFPAEEVEKERKVILEEWRASQDDPGTFFFTEAEHRILDLHPTLGTEDTIRAISRDDLMDFRSSFYNRNNVIFMVAGNLAGIRPKDLAEILRKYDLPEGPFNHIKPRKPLLGSWEEPTIIRYEHASSQAWLGLWTKGLSKLENFQRSWARDILNDALGGGLHSLLPLRIRDELGLAYAVGAGDWDPNLTLTYALINPEQAERCTHEMRQIIQKVAEDGLPQDLLEVSFNHYEYWVTREADSLLATTRVLQDWFYLKDHLSLEDWKLSTKLERLSLLDKGNLARLVQEVAQEMVQGCVITLMNGPAD